MFLGFGGGLRASMQLRSACSTVAHALGLYPVDAQHAGGVHVSWNVPRSWKREAPRTEDTGAAGRICRESVERRPACRNSPKLTEY